MYRHLLAALLALAVLLLAACSSGIGGGPGSEATLTPSIIEVTPRPTSSIFEITPTPYPAGFVIIERGRYTPKFVLKVRAQAGTDQRLLATAAPGYTLVTQGRVMLANGQVWICLKATEDTHGGQTCEGAMIFIDEAGKVYGEYRTP